MASESAATILCTSKQTRFHIESPNYRELDIEGLDISITSSGKPTHQGKTKTEGEGVELLSNAKLRLKGARYALVGKNGTGKSTLLKAIAEKLIPGIPEGTRIAILQQSRIIDKESKKSSESKTGDGSSVLEGVIEHATTKQAIDQEIKILSDGIESSDPYAAVRALRQLKHHRQQQRLFRLDKDARLRSGTRGFQARKVLLAQEKLVRAAQELQIPLMSLKLSQVVRCQLARLLWKRPHCLILDEVTTHLDYETVSALREALHDWEGAVILVSHDRWFMRGVVEGAMEADDNPEDEEDKDIQNLRRRDVYCLMAGKLVKLENGVDQFERITEKQAKRLLMA
ncbi:ABC transporter F family member 4 [Fusarium odoratissimum]|uniref:ABC transporter F family member 4 n=1 Tax=Fusarium oxysporum f. sp. cubense (strain race 4) TaxID=2502994 RepID=N1S788_FUSC4|nr:ABC transporter F family member 4 [Fusarium odoratissimum]